MYLFYNYKQKSYIIKSIYNLKYIIINIDIILLVMIYFVVHVCDN